MATKVPIYLKRGSRKGKKEKLRDILSSDMISPPLGDFRHTIHIGSGGQADTFGDISFLQGKLHLLPRGDGHLELSRASTISGGPEAAVTTSPLLKNAISLPALGGSQALTLPVAPAPPKPPRLHLEETTTAATTTATVTVTVTSPQCPRAANGQPEPLVTHAGSLLSLHVDLGPSILEDVLQVMERHQAERGGEVLT
ncbi:cdc42 effector protein 2 [Sylvia borin]